MTNLLEINLEQELMKQNLSTILTPVQLLQHNQYNTLGTLESNDVLRRLGLNKNLSEGKKIHQTIHTNLKQIEKFDKKRVFHISQIEKICNKYMLKFLPISYYKGKIDADLPQKIVNFELIYGEFVTQTNSFIIAPKESFNLQKKPKDPLFFYKINDEYFYLIHKWGNDLNIFNRIKSLLYQFPQSIIFVLMTIFCGILCKFEFFAFGISVYFCFGIFAVVSWFFYLNEPDDTLFPKHVYNLFYD